MLKTAIIDARKRLGDKARIFVWMPPIIYGNNKKYKRLSIQVSNYYGISIPNDININWYLYRITREDLGS